MVFVLSVFFYASMENNDLVRELVYHFLMDSLLFLVGNSSRLLRIPVFSIRVEDCLLPWISSFGYENAGSR